MNIPYKGKSRPNPPSTHPDLTFCFLDRKGGGGFKLKIGFLLMMPRIYLPTTHFCVWLIPYNLQVPGSSGGRGGAGLVLILSVKGLTIYHIPTTKLQSIHSRSFFPSLKEEENNNNNNNNNNKKNIYLFYLFIYLPKKKNVT
jgi:hypothetical protein